MSASRLSPAQIGFALSSPGSNQLLDATWQQVMTRLSQMTSEQGNSFRDSNKVISRLLNKYPNIGVVLLSSLDTVLDRNSVEERIEKSSSFNSFKTRILRLLCHQIVNAWEQASFLLRGDQKLQQRGSVLVLLSLEDRLARVHTGGAHRLLSDRQANQVITLMKPWLRRELYPEAIRVALSRISRDLDRNAAVRRIIMTIRKWDVLGWLSSLIVLYCFRTWWSIVRYSMQYLAVRKAREMKSQRDAERALLEAEHVRSLVQESDDYSPTAPPLESLPAAEPDNRQEDSKSIETEKDRVVSSNNKQIHLSSLDNDDMDADQGRELCGICLERLSVESPFEEYPPEIRAAHRRYCSNHRRVTGVPALPKLAWLPSRVLGAIRSPLTSSMKSRKWGLFVLPCMLAVANFVGGRKARVTTLTSALSFYISALLWHANDDLEPDGSPNLDTANCSPALNTNAPDDLAQDDTLRTLQSCGHCFHVACLHRWAHHNQNCPLCRAPFASTEEEDEIIASRPPPMPPCEPPFQTHCLLPENSNGTGTSTTTSTPPNSGGNLDEGHHLSTTQRFALDQHVRIDVSTVSSLSSSAPTGKIIRINTHDREQRPTDSSNLQESLTLYDVLLDDGEVRTGLSAAFILPISITSPSPLWMYRQRRQRLQQHLQERSQSGAEFSQRLLSDLLPPERSIYDLFWEDHWWYNHHMVQNMSMHHHHESTTQALYSYYDDRAERDLPVSYLSSSEQTNIAADASARQARWNRLQQNEVIQSIIRETNPLSQLVHTPNRPSTTESGYAWWAEDWMESSGSTAASSVSDSPERTTWWDVVSTTTSANSSASGSTGGGSTGSW